MQALTFYRIHSPMALASTPHWAGTRVFPWLEKQSLKSSKETWALSVLEEVGAVWAPPLCGVGVGGLLRETAPGTMTSPPACPSHPRAEGSNSTAAQGGLAKLDPGQLNCKPQPP